MAGSSNMCIRDIMGAKSQPPLYNYCSFAGYLAPYTQKTNSHWFDLLDTPWIHMQIISVEGKKKEGLLVIVWEEGEARGSSQTLNEPAGWGDPVVQDESPATKLEQQLLQSTLRWSTSGSRYVEGTTALQRLIDKPERQLTILHRQVPLWT